MGELNGAYKVLTLEEKKAMPYSHVFILCQNSRSPHYNKFLEVKVNGVSKVWKRNPEKVRIPFKYGLYQFGYITEQDEVRIPITEQIDKGLTIVNGREEHKNFSAEDY
jgi:hypothetical protein